MCLMGPGSRGGKDYNFGGHPPARFKVQGICGAICAKTDERIEMQFGTYGTREAQVTVVFDRVIPELSMGWVGLGHTKWTHGQL